MMSDCEGNASPPTNKYDFDVGHVGKPKIYLNSLGEPCVFMNQLRDLLEDAFITPSGSDETELSSDESIIPPKNLSNLSLLSSGVQKIREERLNDSNDTLEPKSSKQSPPKAKECPLVDYSDSDDSGEDKRQFHRKKYSKDSDDHRIKAGGKKSYSSAEDRFKRRRRKYSDSSDEDRSQNRRKKSPPKNFRRFHCPICDIAVNSEVNYQAHLQGKRHKKALKSKSERDKVARSMKKLRITPLAQTPATSVTPTLSVKKARRVPMRAESLIQRVAENYKDGPVPGLDDVVEIRPPLEGVRDIYYICNLCEAQCVPNSIMKHLTGFKHYVRYLEKIDPVIFERYRYTPKRQTEEKVRKILLSEERLNGRGRIRVEKESTDNYARRDEPGPSWKEDKPSPPDSSSDNDDDVQYVGEHLNRSMSDFYCKACDAHMNNQAMWESHVRGKRHLENIKKAPEDILPPSFGSRL